MPLTSILRFPLPVFAHRLNHRQFFLNPIYWLGKDWRQSANCVNPGIIFIRDSGDAAEVNEIIPLSRKRPKCWGFYVSSGIDRGTRINRRFKDGALGTRANVMSIFVTVQNSVYSLLLDFEPAKTRSGPPWPSPATAGPNINSSIVLSLCGCFSFLCGCFSLKIQLVLDHESVRRLPGKSARPWSSESRSPFDRLLPQAM